MVLGTCHPSSTSQALPRRAKDLISATEKYGYLPIGPNPLSSSSSYHV